MDVREKLIELFYENNMRCDQKIEGLADDVIDIIDHGVTAQEWIPVTERLPEPKEKAICINRHGDMMIGTYTEWGWMFPCYFEKPTHWMPLPKQPKGE